MESLKELREMLMAELEEVTRKGELTAGSLDTVDKLTHSIKSIDTVLAMKGYSYDGRSYDGRSYDRYSYEGRRRYSRGGIVADLRDMMRDATGPTRTALQRCISEMESN